MARRDTYVVTDGTKSIPLQALRPDAWSPVDDYDVGVSRLSAARAQRIVPILYRAIDIRAKAVSTMPFMLELRGRDVTDDEEYAQMIARLRQLLYLTEAALCICYAAYWQLGSNLAGKQLTPFWLAPQTVQPDIDTTALRPDLALRGYRRTGGTGTPLKSDEVVAFWGSSINVELGPDPLLAPVASVLSAAGLLHNLDAYASGFFTRGGIRMTLLQVEGSPPQEEKDRLQAWWTNLVTGIRSAWRSIVVSSKINPLTIGSDPKDTAAPELSKLAREDVAMGMGVPMALLMLSAPLAGGTAGAERLNFYDFTVVPQVNGVIAPPLNEQYLQRVKMKLTFQPRKLEVYQSAEIEKAKALRFLVGTDPIMFADEARAFLDLPPKAEYLAQQQAVMPAQRAIALDKWQRKALNRLEKGQDAVCSFDSPFLDASTQALISSALGAAQDADAVKAVFGRLLGSEVSA